MSDIVLTASVRQNLLSLQSTADLLATTQNRLSTGKKVNTALDNPTNFFTAQGLDNRAGDINNLLELDRQRRAGAAGRQHRHHLAAEAGRYRKIDRQPGAAGSRRLFGEGFGHHRCADRRGRAVGSGHAPPTSPMPAPTRSTARPSSLRRPPVAATTITVSSTVAAGNVNSIDAFNAALSNAGIGLIANLASDGSIGFTSSNDNASQSLTLGTTAAANTVALSGTGTFALVTPAGGAAGKPLADASSQAIRSNLVSQYNNIITQITTTAQDSSFNGINLLNGDDLKLTFNETGKSTLNIKGVTYNAAGLGLSLLTSGTDFLDNSSANATLTKISNASTTLRTEASSLGSNLSVVQIRQDFNKNLINVLQTGSSNLTLADTNEEAANSQALSTRQSIAVSALALANQSQQSVLKLLQ